MIKTIVLDKPILIPVVVEASKFDDKTLSLEVCALPKDYTLISLDVEVISGFGAGIVATLGVSGDTSKFAKNIDINTLANVHSSTQTTMKSLQKLTLTLSAKPTSTDGKLCIRALMFAPSSTYIEV